jgi:hypothetical protein
MNSLSSNLTMGVMHTPSGVADRQSSYAGRRFQLRNMWNGTLASAYNGGNSIPATPFRAVLNASDYAPSNCNPRYVYDSSDYSRFKKQVASNRDYNRVK